MRFGFEPPKRAGVNNTVTIALEGVAIRVIGLGIAAAAAVVDGKAKACKHGARRLLAGQVRERGLRGLADGAGLGAQRIEQFLRLGRLGG